MKTVGVVSIQKVVRGFLGRCRFRRMKRLRANSVFHANFSDENHLLEYKFKANGAAFQIQNWFRNLSYRRKRKWKILYTKFVDKLKREKVLRRGIRKSKGYNYTRYDLSDEDKRKVAIIIFICRVVRGFLGKRRFKSIKKKVEAERAVRTSNAILIQRVLRRTSVRIKFPLVGKRFRMLQAKRLKYERRISNATRVPLTQLGSSVSVSRSSSAHSFKEDDEESFAHATYLAEHSQILQRRPSLLFLHLKLGDAHFLQSLTGPAVIIQCMIRCFLARRKIQRRRKIKRFHLIAQIKAWLIKMCKKWRRAKALKVIQPVWRLRAQHRFHKKACAVKIQAAWRTHVTRKNFKILLKLRYFSTCILIRWIRRLRCRRVVRGQLRRARQLLELREAGLSCYTATHTRWMAYYMWQGVKVKNYTSQHELQKLFQTNSVNGGLEPSKVAKIMKECKDLVSDTFTLNQVEIQFTKIKNPLEKRIDYMKFVDLLCNLAVLKFMNVDPARIAGAPEDGSNTAPADSAAADMANKIPINSFVYAGLRGRAALVTRFIIEYLTTVVDYKRSAEFLDSKRTSAAILTKMLMKENVLFIQRFLRNRFAVRKITADLRALKARKVAHRRSRASKEIQKVIRGFLGRRRVKRMAQGMYTKFIDGGTEREYWCNPRTNVSYWSKPKLLGEFDCGMATRMPSEEERYAVTCTQCDTTTATCFCVQCDEPFCTMCYAMGHRAGHRKHHAHLLIDNCVQCEFQVGTRYCASCQDTYCDSCYAHMHKRGRLRFHTMERNCEPCEVCNDLSAQWDETLMPGPDNNFKQHKLWCSRCYKDEHGLLPKDVPPQKPPVLSRISFFGKKVKVHKEQQEQAKRLAEIANSFENRKKELAKLKVEKAVRLVQRVFRGYRKRLEIAPFLAERREFLKLRKIEAAERNKLTYKLCSAMGIAKTLKSDTPLERVYKLYPSYMHTILGLSVDNNWTYACKLLTEHEERLKGAPKTNILQRTAAKVDVAMKQRQFDHHNKLLERATVEYSAVAQTYENAQASGAMAPKKLTALQEQLQKAEEHYYKVSDKKSAAEAKLEAAQEHLTDCVGPRGLQRLVARRRSEGVVLPFRVTLTRHSRLALVTYWEEDFDKSEEELALQPVRVPGKWKEHLKLHDFVRIDGAEYRIAQSMAAAAKKDAKRPGSASSVGSESINTSAVDGSKSSKQAPGDPDNSAGSGGGRRRRKLGKSAKIADDSTTSKKKKRPASAASDSSDRSADLSGGSEGFSAKGPPPDRFNLEVEVREETTEEHITLDHPWMLPDAYNVQVYKALPRIFYYKPLFFLRRKVRQSYPVQKISAINAITLHKYAALLTFLQTNFDEESDTYASFARRIQASQEGRDKWLKLSRTIVQMQFDFTLRREVSNLLYRCAGASLSFIKFIRGLMKTASGGAAESPYEYWARSMEKVDVVCIIDKGSDRTTVLGEFKLDLKAPADMMREFIRRAFRAELNTTIGDSFLFFKVDPDSGHEDILLRENEYKTYSNMFCFEKTDNKTMVTSMCILIIPDPNRGRVVIPEFAEEHEDEKENKELEELI